MWCPMSDEMWIAAEKREWQVLAMNVGFLLAMDAFLLCASGLLAIAASVFEDRSTIQISATIAVFTGLSLAGLYLIHIYCRKKNQGMEDI